MARQPFLFDALRRLLQIEVEADGSSEGEEDADASEVVIRHGESPGAP